MKVSLDTAGELASRMKQYFNILLGELRHNVIFVLFMHTQSETTLKVLRWTANILI